MNCSTLMEPKKVVSMFRPKDSKENNPPIEDLKIFQFVILLKFLCYKIMFGDPKT